jgi:ADP-ribose pyrophosphatase YjhB (NUDIX family)
MRWTVHGERSIYESEWVSLHLVDVEIPGGARFDHHVVRAPHPASGTVVHDPDRGILLLWRHRFITDTWGWEIPAGRIDPGESPEECAGRECLEETGWQPGTLERLTTYAPANGMIDPGESERIEWVAVEVIRQEIAAGRVLDGLSLTALLWSFAFGRI